MATLPYPRRSDGPPVGQGGFVAPNLKVAAETSFETSIAGLWVIGGGALLAAVVIAFLPPRVDLKAERTATLKTA